MDVLKPCPFCGQQAKLHIRLNVRQRMNMYAVICPNKSCVGHNLYTLFWVKDDAIKAWNRRTSHEES